MNLQNIIQYLSSTDFEIRYAILSGFSSVLNAFEIDETIQSLIQSLKDNPDNQMIILKRVEALIPDYQADFMHTHDIPVCAYLYALYQVKSLGTIEVVAYQIIEKKEFFWAREMTTKILGEQNSIIHTDIVVFQNLPSDSLYKKQVNIKTDSANNLPISA